jgi:hypothetical protein
MPASESQRAGALDQQLMTLVARGGRIEARMPTSAIVATGTPVNHVLHLVITLLVCGLWLPVWILVAASGGEKRTVVSVDETGIVHSANRMPASPNANWLGRMSEAQATLAVSAALIGGIALITYIAHLI